MDPDYAIPGHCPGCGAEDRLEKASGAVAEAADYASPAHALDPEWPWFLQWSAFQYVAVAGALLAAMAVGAGENDGVQPVSRSLGALLGVGIGLLLVLGALGLRNTWRNRAQARRLGPRVREIHEHAVYCAACSCVYLDARDLPGGLLPYEPMPVADYRWRLWQACGYVRRL